MRSLTLGLSALLLTSFAAAAPTAAAAPADWRAEACAEAADQDAPITGTGTITSSKATRVAELPGVKLISERLDYAGVTCELLYATGSVPAGTVVSGVGYDYTTFVRLVVDGVDQGETEYKGNSGGSGGSSGVDLTDDHLLGAVTYRASDAGVFPTDSSLPPEWQGKPYTATYTRSAWKVTLSGKTLAEKPFKHSDATDRAARAASVRSIAAAKKTYGDEVAQIKGGSSSAAEKKAELAQAKRTQSSSIALAKKTLRLALQGTKLVPSKFKKTYSGALLP